MANHKFKAGQTVTILSRQTDGYYKSWNNTNVGGLGIVEKLVDYGTQADGYEDHNLYGLLLLADDFKPIRRMCWYEEKYLQLYCSNEERGKKILAETTIE